MRKLINTPATPDLLVPARGLVRRIGTGGTSEAEFPEGTVPARGEVRVLHNESGGVILFAARANNPRLTGRVARLFSTGQLRLAGPAALVEFVTTELATQWDEPDPAA